MDRNGANRNLVGNFFGGTYPDDVFDFQIDADRGIGMSACHLWNRKNKTEMKREMEYGYVQLSCTPPLFPFYLLPRLVANLLVI